MVNSVQMCSKSHKNPDHTYGAAVKDMQASIPRLKCLHRDDRNFLRFFFGFVLFSPIERVDARDDGEGGTPRGLKGKDESKGFQTS